MCSSRRLNLQAHSEFVPHTAVGAMTHQVPMVGTRVNLPHVQMHVPGDLPDGWSSDMVVPRREWKADISDTRISHQQFPPVVIDSIDARHLLNTWEDPFLDLFEENNDGWPPLFKTEKQWQADKAMVLSGMLDVIGEATDAFEFEETHSELSRFDRMQSIPLRSVWSRTLFLLLSSSKLEIVGLIPKNIGISLLESGSSAVDRSVLGLAVFSRARLQDDSRGSLRKVAEEQYGKQGTRPWSSPLRFEDDNRELDVIVVEGVAHAPGLSERSAKILSSKIEKYAHTEQKIVVLPKWAYINSDGIDLTEYYVRLGFEKVQMDEDEEAYEYVYTGISSSIEDDWVENQQLMVGIGLNNN